MKSYFELSSSGSHCGEQPNALNSIATKLELSTIDKRMQAICKHVELCASFGKLCVFS